MSRRRDNATKLSDTVKVLMEEIISPRQSRFQEILQLWNQLLPAELQEHCKLGGISGGQLKVLVDSPVYMHELRLCSPLLIEELQTHCPRARIRKIKITIG
ncbi:MAG: DUF721 domain-containing protein [Planctomycetes bacterium]|nr:DUF721 domain-containing protein [Planctomycetota bacterium]